MARHNPSTTSANPTSGSASEATVDVLIVGSGNAALCAGIAALTRGATVLMIEKADVDLAGGNSRYTAGAMRFAYNDADDLWPLLTDRDDERLSRTDFGSYSARTFEADLLGFNDSRPLSPEQRVLIDESLPTMQWLASHGVTFEPIYERQAFEKDGRFVFWGGLTLAAEGEGSGLVDAEVRAFETLGGTIRHRCAAVDLIVENDRVVGAVVESEGQTEAIRADAVVLACGGFEANAEMRVEHLGDVWDHAKVRGTPHNTGIGIQLAQKLGAEMFGLFSGCHATPMDRDMPNYGNLELDHIERKHYRKISYFLGLMVNRDGQRFVDEGQNFRNYTYAQFGRAVLEQPGHVAWQLFDAKVFDLLYSEYRFHDATYTEADDLGDLLLQLDGLDTAATRATVDAFNAAIDEAEAERSVDFDPTIKDGKRTIRLDIDKTNWAQRLDTPPYRAYPVTGGITFTYGGLHVNQHGEVLRADGSPIVGLHACGELVGGVFFNGYPGGSGLTSGAVFGRRAGLGATRHL